jgi:hypothetical protein
MSFEEFILAIPMRVLTEDEIAEKIGSYRPHSLGDGENLALAEAIRSWVGSGAVRGVIRSAVRAQHELAPVPGDPPVPQTDDSGQPV